MGLAAYGRPLYVEHIHRLVQTGPAGQFNLDMTYFDFVTGDKMYSQKLVDLFQHGPRPPDSAIEPFHQDVAHSLQLVLEEILLEKVNYLASRVDSPNLCLAGGVALNSVANGRIHRKGPFSNLFVQPAAGDAGGCLGAAALAHIQITGQRHTTQPKRHVYLGPAARTDELQLLFQTIGIDPHDFRHNDANLYDEIVRRLLAGQIIGWFQGRMEFGPRALGARSILANPMDSTVRDRLNRHIKQREDFRPFAPSVLAEHAATHFDLPQLLAHQ
jgi:carbamoyltransferase